MYNKWHHCIKHKIWVLIRLYSRQWVIYGITTRGIQVMTWPIVVMSSKLFYQGLCCRTFDLIIKFHFTRNLPYSLHVLFMCRANAYMNCVLFCAIGPWKRMAVCLISICTLTSFTQLANKRKLMVSLVHE